VVKKVAVSLTRRAAVLFDSAPVSAMGNAEYLFMNVPMKPPRMMNGAGGRTRCARVAPLLDQLRVEPRGNCSISRIRRPSSAGAEGTASGPLSKAACSMEASRRIRIPESARRRRPPPDRRA